MTNPKNQDFRDSPENSTQRGSIKDTIGFNRYGLLPEEASVYIPPTNLDGEPIPDRAASYLKGLSRTGTMSGACKLAGISVNKIYEYRKKYGLDFTDEEDIAKACLQDVIENELFKCGLGLTADVAGNARVRALEIALRANKPQYNPTTKHEVDADVQLSWLEILKKSQESETGKDHRS